MLKNDLECLVCEYTWASEYRNLKRGCGCPKCGNAVKLTQTEVVEFLAKKNINMLSEYVNNSSLNKVSCNKCGCVWEQSLSNLRKSGCPSCAKTAFDPSIPATLYYGFVVLNNKKYYKIGITNQCTADRTKLVHTKFNIIREYRYENGLDAQIEERRLLDKYRNNRVILKGEVKTGFTEFFNEDILSTEYNGK